VLLLAAYSGILASIVETFTVPLKKQHVPVIINNRTVTRKTAYFGTIHVGLPNPQTFTVVFDTGSGHLFLPASECNDTACRLHRTYSREASSTAVEINSDGTEVTAISDEERDAAEIAYGTGEIVGDFVREIVCLGEAAESRAAASASQNCANVRMITAKQMSSQPFSSFEFDGVLGLGLTALALDPEFHVFGQLVKGSNGLKPSFSVFLSRDDDTPSEITFGGHNENRLQGAISWAQVTSPEEGYWRVKIKNIRVGDEVLRICDVAGGCSGILDTGTSMLGVPPQAVSTLLWHTAREAPDESGSEFDCRQLPAAPIVFDLGDFTVSVDPQDYFRPTPSVIRGSTKDKVHTICRASLLPVNLPALGNNVFLMGEPLLKKYYTAYDAHNGRVGFALAARPTNDKPQNSTAGVLV